MEQVKFNIGDIVKLTKDGEEIVGIVYENGNVSNDIRVQSPDGKKYKWLKPEELTPATEDELATFRAVGVPTSAKAMVEEAEAKAKLMVEEATARAKTMLEEASKYTPAYIIDREAGEHTAKPVTEGEGEGEDGTGEE